ncbi:MAG: hypothetical protein IJW93_02885 [Clostridia bacterium]|nr:hypothetical protein [Clostridia bacterium]
MKKCLSLLICIVLLLCLTGCTPGEPIIMLEYKGTPLTSLSYKSVDYMGGFSTTTLIDFEKNTVTVTKYNPYAAEQGKEEYTTDYTCDFTDEAEMVFINKVYSFGLFSILPRYENNHVDDGGGWDLVIEYENGQQKRSSGSNAAPGIIFSACAIPFYRLTGIDVLGRVPTEYKYPPNLSYAMHYECDNYDYSAFIHSERANYRWNDHTVSGINIYDMTMRSIREMYENPLIRGLDYSLVIYTSNYKTSEYDKFKSIEIRSYNIDPELTDEKLVYSSGWFDREEIFLELDRIYLVTMEFYNGDFVEYTFNTVSSDQKILYGFYSYSITDIGHLQVDIYDDGSFTLDEQIYYDRDTGKYPYPNPESLNGSWDFETIDGAEYLVLTADGGDRLVFEYSIRNLVLNTEKTTLDLKKYHLDEVIEDNRTVVLKFIRYKEKDKYDF